VRKEEGGERGGSIIDICDKYGYSLVPRLLPSFLSHTVQKTGVFCTVCDKKLGRSLRTRLYGYTNQQTNRHGKQSNLSTSQLCAKHGWLVKTLQYNF